MSRYALKLLLILEVAICFVPMIVLLLFGLLLIPLQFVALADEPLLWQGPAYLIGSVIFGFVGLVTMAYVLWNLLRGVNAIMAPELVFLGAVIGAIPILPMALFGDPWGWKVTAMLPLVVSAHVLFLARRFVFPSRRVVYRSVAVGLIAAVVVPLLLLLNPLSTSRATIIDQQNIWESTAPDRYEYTVQLSGWRKPDELLPKRIEVESGEVVLATYLWDRSGHSAGDPAVRESLWTIARAFDELLGAKDDGWSVSVRFDERHGYVKRAYVEKSFGSSSGWDFEVREFRVLDEATE